MKRMFALLLALVMVLSLAACGGGKDGSQSGDQGGNASGTQDGGESKPSADPITIKLPHCYSEGHPLTDTLENYFKPELESRSGEGTRATVRLRGAVP